MDRTRIEQLLRSAAASPDVLSFAGGLPAEETFPRLQIAEAADAAIFDMGAAPLQYDWPEGRLPLRELIAERLRARGADVDAADVIVTNGAQEAITLAMAVLSPPEIQVDALSYPGALDLFRGRGCRLTTGAAAVRYAMPALCNPTGRVATAEEREAMLSARWILEDDAYADLGFAAGERAAPLVARAPSRVFHIGSFSKTLLPGLRVGWLVPPRSWKKAARDAKSQRDLHTCGLAQAIVERFLSSQDFDVRLGKLRFIYRRRCQLLADALRGIPNLRFTVPRGGFSIWAETDLHLADESWLQLAIESGVSLDPGGQFAAEPDERAPLAMRLSFSAIAEEKIAEGARRLADALERCHH